MPDGSEPGTSKQVLHGQSDDRCLTSSADVAAGLQPTGGMLVVQTVRPASPSTHAANCRNGYVSWTTECGCERNGKESSELLDPAPSRLQAIHAARSRVSLVEVVRGRAR